MPTAWASACSQTSCAYVHGADLEGSHRQRHAMFAKGFHARRWHCPRACGEAHLVPIGVSRDPEVFEIAHPARAAIWSSRTSLPLCKAVVADPPVATAPI